MNMETELCVFEFTRKKRTTCSQLISTSLNKIVLHPQNKLSTMLLQLQVGRFSQCAKVTIKMSKGSAVCIQNIHVTVVSSCFYSCI
jgi:hypothetical protein